ncbi:MAG: TetR/AcrR family transcriptional regulator [Solirubrobacterales bacterium]
MATQSPGSGRLSADERREQLLDATKAIVARAGFHAVTIEGVAREAGITRPVVYGHFDDLPALLEALVDREGTRALTQLARVLPRPPAGADDRRALLLTALETYLEAVRADPDTWGLVLMPPEGAPALLRERIAAGRAAAIAELAEAIRPGLVPGRGSPDRELTARTMSALADDAARLVLTDPTAFPPERILAHARWLLGELGAGSS